MTEWTTRTLMEHDRDEWSRLFEGYCAFYQRELTPEHLDRVWAWLQGGDLIGLVAEDPAVQGRLVGLAHVRAVVRPTVGEVAGYLDDLFVDPEERGGGVVDELFEAIRAQARTEGWNHVRWITSEDNYRARAVYDRLATRTQFLTYHLDLGD
ncbi:GNAT family N-acetyltransferase [Arthrobacter sp. RAF14]|uniref:GNAT family N-acetyltransferase n=1 Tax=Arthrobacter sp. RAF14 TaxID=3233051 RepID=UPI003F8E7004